MATMQDIINDVLTELRYQPGRDVQIHLQDGIARNVSRLYRTLMLKYIWRDYMFQGEYTTDVTTGQVTADLSSVLTKFSNILAVYEHDREQPMQFAPALINSKRYHVPVIVPVAGPKVFAIFPTGTARNILLVSRVYQDTDFGLDDEVPFYRDLLSLGGAFMLSEKSGTNNELTKSLKEQFEQLLNTYRDQELKPQYLIDNQRGGIPLDWYTTDGTE